MAREKCGLLAVPRTTPISWETYLFVLDFGLRYSVSAVFVAPALQSAMLSQCVTFRETVSIYYEKHTEHTDTLCGQNAES
jgi:hypothetical protein